MSCWNIEPGYIDARGIYRATAPETVNALMAVLKRDNNATSARTLARANQTCGIVLAARATAYRPSCFQKNWRAWLLAVQLYAVKSARNWGHGDFTDLKILLKIAADAGAAGVGVNPLHALAPGQASPYSPSSREFLNPLYIDIEATPEFPEIQTPEIDADVAHLRAASLIDYAAVGALKQRVLTAVFAVFSRSASDTRRNEFAEFRTRAGEPLVRYTEFEARRTHGISQAPDFHAFVQWIAHSQLESCSRLATKMNMPIGLYLDVAVGVDPAGADAWCSPQSFPRGLSVGAPPDIFNPAGQNWGLATLHPQELMETDFAQFRQVLRSAMRYAGAIRIDHALGLYRLYLIPEGLSAAQGGYVRYPFEALLAVIAQESVEARCLVIGEDLGTIPKGICEALNECGIWSYRVALFEQDAPGHFKDAQAYPADAIVTFNTHDLPPFSSWLASHDLAVRQGLKLDSAESEDEREQSRSALRAALASHGISSELTLQNVIRFLARTPARLLAVSLEDILGLPDQPNIPGTIDEHPNWRRRLPIDIEELATHPALKSISVVLADEGRSSAAQPYKLFAHQNHPGDA